MRLLGLLLFLRYSGGTERDRDRLFLRFSVRHFRLHVFGNRFLGFPFLERHIRVCYQAWTGILLRIGRASFSKKTKGRKPIARRVLRKR